MFQHEKNSHTRHRPFVFLRHMPRYKAIVLSRLQLCITFMIFYFFNLIYQLFFSDLFQILVRIFKILKVSSAYFTIKIENTFLLQFIFFSGQEFFIVIASLSRKMSHLKWSHLSLSAQDTHCKKSFNAVQFMYRNQNTLSMC